MFVPYRHALPTTLQGDQIAGIDCPQVQNHIAQQAILIATDLKVSNIQCVEMRKYLKHLDSGIYNELRRQ